VESFTAVHLTAFTACLLVPRKFCCCLFCILDALRGKNALAQVVPLYLPMTCSLGFLGEGGGRSKLRCALPGSHRFRGKLGPRCAIESTPRRWESRPLPSFVAGRKAPYRRMETAPFLYSCVKAVLWCCAGGQTASRFHLRGRRVPGFSGLDEASDRVPVFGATPQFLVRIAPIFVRLHGFALAMSWRCVAFSCALYLKFDL
jgi:hypothetical protein